MDGHACGQHRAAVGQFLGGRRLVRDECPDLPRVLGHQGECVHGAAAAGEDVDGCGVERGDRSVKIVRVLIRRGFGGVVGALAALRAARVVRHDCAVREMRGEGAESGGAHRRPDEQQCRLGTGTAAADVVTQHRARHFEGACLRFGHG